MLPLLVHSSAVSEGTRSALLAAQASSAEKRARALQSAARLLHVGRYGGSSEDERLWPLFVGYSTLVRGYDPNSFDTRDCTPTPDGSCPELVRLTGSRMVVFNGEARVPVTHRGILLDGKADGPEVAGHLIGRPRADLWLTDQSEDQPRDQPAMLGVVVHDQRRTARTPAADRGKRGAHRRAREVHDHTLPDPAGRRRAIVSGLLENRVERFALEVD